VVGQPRTWHHLSSPATQATVDDTYVNAAWGASSPGRNNQSVRLNTTKVAGQPATVHPSRSDTTQYHSEVKKYLQPALHVLEPLSMT